MSDLEDVTRDYRAGFLRFLPRRSETAGYELGRRAATSGAGLLDLVRAHHRILNEVLARQPSPDTNDVMDAGCEFLSAVLSTFDMAHRVLHDPPTAQPQSP